MNNIGFQKSDKEPVTDYKGTKYDYGVSAFINHEIDDELSLETGLKYDPILRNTVQARFTYSRDYFRVGVGPFLGIFNTKNSLLKSGISSSVRVEYPGKVFASVRSDSTIAARFSKDGDYLQEFNKLTFGYYIPNAICSLNLETKRFVTQESSSLEIEDSSNEYSFEVDIYQKNIPLRLLLSFAYRSTLRIYNDTNGGTNKNTLNSLIFGTRMQVEAGKRLTLIADIDHNVYSFGKNTKDEESISLPDSGLGVYLFELKLGGTWRFD